MKKSYLILVILFLVIVGHVQAQITLFTNDLETWNGNEPIGLRGSKTTFAFDSILPYTVSSHSPTHAVQLINSTSSHKRFTTTGLSVTNGTVYTVNFWVRGKGDVRIGLFDDRATGSGYAPYSAWVTNNSTNWTLFTQTITCANTTTIAEFIISVRNTLAAGDHIQVDDVSITYGGGGNPAIVISSPAENATVFGTSVNIVFAVANFVVGNPGTGIDGHIHYTVDGGGLTMVYNTNPITLSGLTVGAHEVILQLVDNSHNPLVPNVADTVHFTCDINPQITTIHDIQYTTEPSGDSPYLDEVVTTGGIVTARHASGYFIQAGTGAWNGVYVYDNVNVPGMGDSVIITGKVAEYYNLTEIKTVTAFGVINSGNPLPAPVVGDCSVINSEENEGVLVKAEYVICTNINAGFGMWKIQDMNGDTAKVHNLIYTYTPTLGTTYIITGPVYYSFNEYRIEPRTADDIVIYTSVKENDAAGRLLVFPNPGKDIINISGVMPGERGVIVNSLGQIVKSFTMSNYTGIDISALQSGLYFIRIPEKGMIEKIVVE
jgi:hypothetical protein